MANMEASRQTAWDSLNQALCSLEETATIVLGSAISVERRLLGDQPRPDSGTESVSPSTSLIGLLEQRIRSVLRQAREVQEILATIETDIN